MKWKYDLKLLLFPLDAFAHIVHSQVKGTSLLDNAPNQLVGCFIQKKSTILYIYIRKLIWWKKEIIFVEFFDKCLHVSTPVHTCVRVYKIKILVQSLFYEGNSYFYLVVFFILRLFKKRIVQEGFLSVLMSIFFQTHTYFI